MAATLNDRDITRIFYAIQDLCQMLTSVTIANRN